jgi:hypothetical protein
MKIAYLILAHDDPRHLRRLVEAVQDDWTQIYVHIDKKAELARFTRAIDLSRVTFIPDRVSACWGGFSLVQATLNLMAAARHGSTAPDWYALISGADYPIRSNRAIRDCLHASDREHISLIEMPSADGRKPLDRLERLHFEHACGRYVPQRVLLTQTNRLLEKYYKRDYRRVLGDIKPYAGSQWWVLSREAVDNILSFVETNPQLVRFYRHTLIPDEMFFHTILGNSPFRSKAARNLTFANWTEAFSRNPRPITPEHVAEFADPDFYLDDIEGVGPCFFARKFTSRNRDLLDRIDEIRAVAEVPSGKRDTGSATVRRGARRTAYAAVTPCAAATARASQVRGPSRAARADRRA